MATILGLHYGHHGTICLVKDGKLVGAVSTERIIKLKFVWGINKDTIDYFLEKFNVGQIDYIAISDWNKQFAYDYYKETEGLIQVYQDGKVVDNLWNSVYENTCLQLEVDFYGKRYPGFMIGHQLCHAAAAYYTSPFDEAFCFTLDASGADLRNNSLVSYGNGKELTSLYCPNLMIGVGYGNFVEWLGFGSQLIKAGSMMALAGYGEVLPKVLANIDYYVKGNFIENNSYLDGRYIGDYHQWHKKLWSDLNGSGNKFPWCWDFALDNPETKKAQGIAASIQFIFEEAILRGISAIDSKGNTNLCLGGGSFLNCLVNSRILLESKFKNVHLFPGCGDDGGAVGCALYVSHHILKEERPKYKDSEICYLGPDKPVIEPDYQYLAKQIANNKVIAWCNGKSEFGPRALGNRSILADPRIADNRDRINFRVKDRAWYRPLAPSIMEEYLEDWFEFKDKSPFMLHTAKMKQPDVIPAVNHVDNTARIQTVTEEINPYYYRLIKEFHSLTGVPILLNTSLNENGEPIIETDEQALEFFNRGKVDILVLNGKIIERE